MAPSRRFATINRNPFATLPADDTSFLVLNIPKNATVSGTTSKSPTSTATNSPKANSPEKPSAAWAKKQNDSPTSARP